ncbi:cellulose biosynthesis cyclic di-GMP-binding regulatory protein BcsB [Paenibacillus sp. CN-4]|uniref:cellulose biosynthesis cyclic di-GMP-binding regulatory protein BcsB n=1 Tax=Paenibacillus nanchangensis TaxID=3348343 RepID=UPI003978B283
MIRKKLILYLVVFTLLVLPALPAQAAVTTGADGRVYRTPFAQTEPMSGAEPVRQEYFQVPDYWNVGSVVIRLDFQVSQLTREQSSSITLALNGNPFHTFRPSAANNGHQRLTISAPKAWLKEGANLLEVRGHIRTTEDRKVECSVDVTPDNWLHLYNTSSIDVNYRFKEHPGTIDAFLERMTGMDLVEAGDSAVTVPSEAVPAELEAAAQAMTGLSRMNASATGSIPMLAYLPGNLEGRDAIVLISRYDRLPESVKSEVDGAGLDQKALLQVLHPETQPLLVVTSNSDDLLVQAGRLLANPELTAQLSQPSKTVDAETNVATPAVDYRSIMPLTETGEQITGPYHQERTYFIPLPAGRAIADAGKISLNFRYAENLDFNRSLVTVRINDTPIGSKRLSAELAGGDKATFSIPKSVRVSGNFSVTVAFDLEIESLLCTPNQGQTPWAYIDPGSQLQINTKDRTELLLDNYPYPFLRDGAYNKVAVVLPDQLDDYTYMSLSNVLNLMGKYAQSNMGEVKFFLGNASADELKDRNVIAFGTYKTNGVIRDVNDKLYFRYDDSGSRFMPNEKMSIDEQYGAKLGTLQLIESPYREGGGLLAVTGAGSEYYYLASKLVATEQTKWKVYGDGVAADKDGNVFAYRFKKDAAPEQASVLEEALRRPDVLAFTTAAVLVMVTVLLSLFLLIRKHMKKRGGKRET